MSGERRQSSLLQLEMEVMNRKNGLFLALLAVLALALVLSLGSCQQGKPTTEQISDLIFPQALSSRLELHAGELSRQVYYASDGTTKVSATIHYKGEDGKSPGKTAYVSYRTKGAGFGTISHVKIFYPQIDSGPAPIAREIELDVDGKTFLTDNQYRTDGSLSHTGRMSGGRYSSSDFQADGRSLVRYREFARDAGAWIVAEERIYFPDGRVSESTQTTPDNGLELNAYSDTPEHQLVWHAAVNQYRTNAVTDYYAADGKTVFERVTEEYSSYTVEAFQDGKLVESRLLVRGFGSRQVDSMDVSIYGADGKLKFVQSWNRKTPESDVSDDDQKVEPLDLFAFKLDMVRISNSAGETVSEISIADDGNVETISVLEVPDMHYPRVDTTFRADGTVEEVIAYNGVGNKIKDEKHDASENLRQAVDPELLKPRPFHEPTQILPRFDSRPE